MRRGILLTIVALPFSLGAACELSCGPISPGNPPSTELPLDLANCVLTIIEDLDGTVARMSAQITSSQGRPVRMTEEQSVVVNGEPLDGPDADDEYLGTLAVADRYEVVVTEPTRGVVATSIDAPPAFGITAPAEGGDASLSGFTLEWSHPTPDVQVRIALRQSILGSNRQRTYGPVPDTGGFEFSAADLAAFQQGADLTAIVTKISTLGAVNGFNSGTLTVIRSARADVTPTP